MNTAIDESERLKVRVCLALILTLDGRQCALMLSLSPAREQAHRVGNARHCKRDLLAAALRLPA